MSSNPKQVSDIHDHEKTKVEHGETDQDPTSQTNRAGEDSNTLDSPKTSTSVETILEESTTSSLGGESPDPNLSIEGNKETEEEGQDHRTPIEIAPSEVELVHNPHVSQPEKAATKVKEDMVADVPDELSPPVCFSQSGRHETNEPDVSSMELEHQEESLVSGNTLDLPKVAETKSLSQEKLETLIATAIENDERETQKEREEITSALKTQEVWYEFQKNLHASILRLDQMFNQTLEEFYKEDEQLPLEVREFLTSRKEGIQLCARMLDKLVKRTKEESIPGKNEVITHPESLESKTLLEILRKPSKHPDEELAKILKGRRINNNQILADIKRSAGKEENKHISTIERQMFPIIDGLVEGQKIGVSVIQDLNTRFREYATQLENWFGIYEKLIKALESELKTLQVEPLPVQKGDAIDYEQHEPFDVEEDLALQNEQIKEIIRRGYILRGFEGQPDRILRPSQVVVVKNSPKE